MKFSIGEVCEAMSGAGHWPGWAECEIKGPLVEGYYDTYISCAPSPHITKQWRTPEYRLRKKRPPQDMSEFTFDELINDLNKVPA